MTKPFGDIRDLLSPPCPNTGYDCGKKECDPAKGRCGFPPEPPGRGYKVWGTTTPLIVTPMFEMHRLVIKPWHRCSYHHHQFKHNAFYVIQGILHIDWQRIHAMMPVPTTLWAGGTLTVKPGVPHQFRTGAEPCIVLEMYYTEPLSEDIIRHNVGAEVEQR